MNVVALKVLATGQLSDSAAPIYTCPAAESVDLHEVNFVHVGTLGLPETVVVYSMRTSIEEVGRETLLREGWRYEFVEIPIRLEPGDQILAEASHVSSVEFVVQGVVRDAASASP
jgi:nitrogen fixation protein